MDHETLCAHLTLHGWWATIDNEEDATLCPMHNIESDSYAVWVNQNGSAILTTMLEHKREPACLLDVPIGQLRKTVSLLLLRGLLPPIGDIDGS